MHALPAPFSSSFVILLPLLAHARLLRAPTHPRSTAADILLGYHSEEGWTATLRLFSGHYGLEAEASRGVVGAAAADASVGRLASWLASVAAGGSPCCALLLPTAHCLTLAPLPSFRVCAG